MGLPKNDHVTFTITIPSTQVVRKFRPFLVKEEKILLTASQSNESTDILHAVDQVITNCALDDDFTTDALTTFDFDYVFIKLRAASVNNTITLEFTDPDDEEYKSTVLVNLDEITVSVPDTSNKVVTESDVTIVLRYPTMKEMLAIIAKIEESVEEEEVVDFFDLLLINCIDKIYNDEEVFDTYTDAELIEFLDGQTPATYEKIRAYLSNVPDVTHTVTYTTKEGEEANVVLKGINDFFTWQ